jgi:hypothetical protein
MRSVFEKSTTKLMGQSISNGWIHASNEYLQTVEGKQMVSFHDGLDTYLTKEQYAMVKHVGLNFISCLLHLNRWWIRAHIWPRRARTYV